MPEITGILLAAGFSSRFGTNKLMTNLHGQPLIVHSVSSLAPCSRIIAVVRGDDPALLQTLQAFEIDYVINPQPERGMGYSIACGVNASPNSDGWCILPADMPCILRSSTQQVIDALRGGAALVVPVCHGRRGHPVGFGAKFFKQLTVLDSDVGARSILELHTDELTTIATEDAGVLADIDTQADLGKYFPRIS